MSGEKRYEQAIHKIKSSNGQQTYEKVFNKEIHSKATVRFNKRS